MHINITSYQHQHIKITLKTMLKISLFLGKGIERHDSVTINQSVTVADTCRHRIVYLLGLNQ